MPTHNTILTQAHILHFEGADPARDRYVRENQRVRMIIVFVPDPEAAPAVAAELVNHEGASLIELDGGLGPIWTARVLEAVGGSVPVGTVMFEAESLAGAAATTPPEAEAETSDPRHDGPADRPRTRLLVDQFLLRPHAQHLASGRGVATTD